MVIISNRWEIPTQGFLRIRVPDVREFEFVKKLLFRKGMRKKSSKRNKN